MTEQKRALAERMHQAHTVLLQALDQMDGSPEDVVLAARKVLEASQQVAATVQTTVSLAYCSGAS